MNVELSAVLRRLHESGQAELATQLEGLFAAITERATEDPTFANDLLKAVGGELRDRPVARSPRSAQTTSVSRRSTTNNGRSKRGRRKPGPFNPYETFAFGEAVLRKRLNECTIDELRDIVAEHGMDYDRLALKWKTPERLVERITEVVSARSRKGDAFMGGLVRERELALQEKVDQQRRRLHAELRAAVAAYGELLATTPLTNTESATVSPEMLLERQCQVEAARGALDSFNRERLAPE